MYISTMLNNLLVLFIIIKYEWFTNNNYSIKNTSNSDSINNKIIQNTFPSFGEPFLHINNASLMEGTVLH